MTVGQSSAYKPQWFKSSYSGGNATECLEAAFTPDVVLIRDSKRSSGPRLTVSKKAWVHFIADVPAR
ncbi:DUF397 domain-containing protein [Streptomyces sp. NPDC096538]|uniref:DUF397 domain-containing protein n=1 Tax=Streptomyces sp. NPDC096538 TaxID=3155427 RepID=UPI003323E5D0